MLLNPGLFFKVLINSRKFDIIHTYFPAAFAPICSALTSYLRKKSSPVVLTYCNDPPVRSTIYDQYIHFLLKNVNIIVSISDNYVVRSDFLKQYRSKTTVIPVGVDLNRFNPPSNSDLTPNIESPYILFVSKLDKFHAYKGLDVLLYALKSVILQYPEIKLLVVGSGELKPAYEHLINVLGLNNNVMFLDIKIYENIEYYYNSEFVVVPTKHGRQEGFGLVAVEALACKKPVITTKYVASHKDIAENNLGIVVPPKNKNQLAEAIIHLLTDKSRSKKMGENGRTLVEQKYSYLQIAKQYDSLFNSL